VRHPQRLLGVAGMLGWRFMVRRRSSAVTRDGGPSVAVMPGREDLGSEPLTQLDGRPVVDLRGYRTFTRAWLRLLRRPTGAALVGSRLQTLPLRAIGVRPIAPQDPRYGRGA
jgi:hypothetical protein